MACLDTLLLALIRFLRSQDLYCGASTAVRCHQPIARRYVASETGRVEGLLSGGPGTGSTAGTTFSASSGSSPAVTIAKASPSSVTLTSSTANPVQATAFTLTITVTTPTNTSPTGSINFRDSANASLSGCSAVALTGSGTSKSATCNITETATGSKTYDALYSADVNFTAGSNPTLTLTINPSVPANNNTGNNSAADPVLIDVFYVHPDHLGTPRAVTNPATNLKVWEWESTPFGETLANENPQNLTGTPLATGQFRYNLRFPGQFFDAESGKHYNYFRDYDPLIGRYVESDPIGLRGGINTFGYVSANPLKFIDPEGLHKGDPWFGYNDKDFHKWFHRCWKRKGDPDADKDDIEAAYDEWVRSGSPKGGKCGSPPPPPPPPAPVCGDDCKQKVATVVVAGGATYIVYRCIRLIPSLLPPLWWTIPGNVVTP